MLPIRELVTTDSTVLFVRRVKLHELRVLPGRWPQEEGEGHVDDIVIEGRP